MHESRRLDSHFCHLDTLFVLDLAFVARAIGENGLTEVRHGKNGMDALSRWWSAAKEQDRGSNVAAELIRRRL